MQISISNVIKGMAGGSIGQSLATAYRTRVLADGGTYENNSCLVSFLNSLQPDLYNDASLIMYPSGYKSGKIYSQKPIDGTGDLTVTRASTATRINESLVRETVAANVPRIDYLNGCGQLLLEPQRTNLNRYYNQLSATNATVNLNARTSPDGTTNAVDLIFAAATTNGGGTIAVGGEACTGATEYTISFWANNISGNGIFEFRVDTNTTPNFANHDFTIINGWNFYEYTFTTDSGATSFGAGTRFRFGANGALNNHISFYGIQLEKGSYASSTIVTNGSTVTRVQDIGTNNLTTALQSANILGATSGTFIWHCNLNGIAEARAVFALGSTVGFISLADGRTAIRYNSFGTYGSLINRGMGEFKIGLVWNGTSLKSFINGSLVDDVTMSGTITPTSLLIFNPSFGVGINQRVQSVYAASTNLTDAKLIELTTL